MECTEVEKINEKIRELYDVMCTILPLERIGEHPFGHFQSMVARVICSIDLVISEVRNQRDEMQGEIDESVSDLRRMNLELELPDVVIPDIHNLFMVREYVRNETDRAMMVRRAVGSRMLQVIGEIKETKEELGMADVRMQEIDGTDSGSGAKDEVSVEMLRQLEKQRDDLRNERQTREQSRDMLYRETCVFLSELCMKDDEARMDQKICLLEELHRRYKGLVEDRRKEVMRLESEIRRKEKYLDVVNREIEGGLGDEDMCELRKYNLYLEEEQKRLLGSIYQKCHAKLSELVSLFGMEMGEYEETERDVEEMKVVIETLEPKRELFLSIVSLIERRQELLERMNEFERIASDPRRLFKSSFQLVSEEKFRNSAFPNLMKMEEAIFLQLDEYESRFGEFRRDGVGYKEALRQEIENRIVNRTVFINRYDSPSKKRRS